MFDKIRNIVNSEEFKDAVKDIAINVAVGTVTLATVKAIQFGGEKLLARLQERSSEQTNNTAE